MAKVYYWLFEKNGFNNEIDSKFDDETNMPVVNGSLKSQKFKITHIS